MSVTPKLSLCMIVRNEEAMLPGCLDSVRDLVDEIVVVDTGSSDRTVKLAESYRATVAHFGWRDDFAAARNESLRHATGEWILVLDADERLRPEGRGELERLIERDDIAGVNVWLASRMPDDLTAKVLAARYCRLFRKLAGVAFTGLVHEQVLPSIHRLGRKVIDSEIVIDHLGYGGANPAKLERNLRLLEREIAARPHDPFAYFNLGMTLHGIGRWEESSRALRLALDLGARDFERGLQALAWSKIADNSLLLDQPQDALTAAEASLAIDPSSALARYSHAMSLARLQEREKALEELKTLLSGSSDGGLRVQIRMELVLGATGGLLIQLGRPREAVPYYQQAIHHADCPQLYYLLGSALVFAQEFDEAGRAFAEAAKRHYPMARERQELCRALAQMREAVE
ncbi:MAG TPA: glycosyltransferase [Methylomirabilota bacterium]|nr:glycosyltransferase [Methylomirabilota bacterium]